MRVGLCEAEGAWACLLRVGTSGQHFEPSRLTQHALASQTLHPDDIWEQGPVRKAKENKFVPLIRSKKEAMNAASIKIENKKYRLISEDDYLTLLQDIKDLKKVLKRRSESGTEARSFFKAAESKLKAKQ